MWTCRPVMTCFTWVYPVLPTDDCFGLFNRPIQRPVRWILGWFNSPGTGGLNQPKTQRTDQFSNEPTKNPTNRPKICLVFLLAVISSNIQILVNVVYVVLSYQCTNN